MELESTGSHNDAFFIADESSDPYLSRTSGEFQQAFPTRRGPRGFILRIHSAMGGKGDPLRGVNVFRSGEVAIYMTGEQLIKLSQAIDERLKGEEAGDQSNF